MYISKTSGWLLTCTLLLSACGGGGGGSSSNASSPAAEQAWLTFTPNPVTVEPVEGQSINFTIAAHASKTISQTFNIAIVEPNGLITSQVQVIANGQYDYEARLSSNPLLTAGAHNTQLEVRLCEDAPLVCSKPISGSPWHIPLTINVKPAAPISLVFNTSSFNLNAGQGEPLSFSLSAGVNGTLVGQHNIVVFEKNGILSQSVTPMGPNAVSGSPNQIQAQLQTNANLPPGNYNTTLEVRACIDDPAICSRPVNGSPWKLPLTLLVEAPLNLKAMPVLPGIGAWSTTQGNAAHTGAINASFNPSQFNRRFSLSLPTDQSTRGDLALDGNAAYFVTYGTYKWVLHAVGEDSGVESWKAIVGDSGSRLSSPAAENGKVYLTSSDSLPNFGSYNFSLWSLEQGTGAVTSKQTATVPRRVATRPTIYNGSIYSGIADGMARWNASATQSQWTAASPISQLASDWTPAVDAQYAYAYIDGHFYVVDAASGAVALKIENEGYSTSETTSDAVMLGNGIVYARYDTRLAALDLARRTVTFHLDFSEIAGPPALGQNALYLLDNVYGQLGAYDPVSGAKLWSIKLGRIDYRTVIVSNNLAFVSGDTDTIAIDLNSHQVVWRYSMGGSLAISNRGVLYILSAQKLTAINLQ